MNKHKNYIKLINYKNIYNIIFTWLDNIDTIPTYYSFSNDLNSGISCSTRIISSPIDVITGGHTAFPK